MTIRIEVVPEKCLRCGACIRDCLAKILIPAAGSLPQMIPGGEASCFRCQHCMAVCPAGALSWSGKKPEDSLPVEKNPAPESVRRLIKNRRSIRSYRPENVPLETIRAIHETMPFIPTGCNDHRLHFAYSETREITDSFRSAAVHSVLDRLEAGNLPKNIAHFAKLESALRKNTDLFFRTAPHFAAISAASDAKDAHIDPYIAAASWELLAASYCLGTCWGGMATDLFLSDPALLNRLNLPNGYDLKIILLFGYPAVHYPRLPQPESYPMNRLN